MMEQDDLILRRVAAAYFTGDEVIPCGEARAAIEMCPAADLPADWLSKAAILSQSMATISVHTVGSRCVCERGEVYAF